MPVLLPGGQSGAGVIEEKAHKLFLSSMVYTVFYCIPTLVQYTTVVSSICKCNHDETIFVVKYQDPIAGQEIRCSGAQKLLLKTHALEIICAHVFQDETKACTEVMRLFLTRRTEQSKSHIIPQRSTQTIHKNEYNTVKNVCVENKVRTQVLHLFQTRRTEQGKSQRSKQTIVLCVCVCRKQSLYSSFASVQTRRTEQGQSHCHAGERETMKRRCYSNVLGMNECLFSFCQLVIEGRRARSPQAYFFP